MNQIIKRKNESAGNRNCSQLLLHASQTISNLRTEPVRLPRQYNAVKQPAELLNIKFRNKTQMWLTAWGHWHPYSHATEISIISKKKQQQQKNPRQVSNVPRCLRTMATKGNPIITGQVSQYKCHAYYSFGFSTTQNINKRTIITRTAGVKLHQKMNSDY